MAETRALTEDDLTRIAGKLHEQATEVEGDLRFMLDPAFCIDSLVSTREFARQGGPRIRTQISVEILTDG